MTDQRERLERALRGCAEQGVADRVELWPAIRERVSTETMPAEGQATGEQIAPRQRVRTPQLVPNTPLGWTLAVLSVLIVVVGAYAASGPVNELFRQGLPSDVGPGVEKTDRSQTADDMGVSYRYFREALPGGEGPSLEERIGQKQTMDGAKVALEWAYADAEFVVLGISVEDLRQDRRNAGNPASLEPIFVNKEDENVPSAPDRRSELTDESGRHFPSIDGMSEVPGPGSSPEEIKAPKAHTAVFEVPEGLETGPSHRFRFSVFLEEAGVPTSMKEAEAGWRVEDEPPIGPLVFDFEIPVHPVSVVEVNEKETTKGITLTLKRIINSPSKPQAVICVEPPDEDHLWHPSMEQTGYASDEPPSPRRLEGDCWSMGLGDPVEGRSSVTVTEIWGIPQTAEAARRDEDGPQIRGPWTFEFGAPG